MDEGPFRAPQPAERRVPSRQEATPRAAAVDKSQPVKEAPKPTYRERTEIPSFDEPKKRRPFKRIIALIIVVIALLGLGFGAWSVFSKTQNSAETGINSNEYQAVFFTSGEVYFGKLVSFNDKYMKLTNIFYLQSSTSSDATSTAKTTTTSSNAQLIKMGSEAYGPEDTMIISRDQISRYMNLKSDSKVVQLINQYSAK